MDAPNCIRTDHFINRAVVGSFARGCGGKVSDVGGSNLDNRRIATYGILRGAGDIIKKSDNFFYIDRGYYGAGKADCKGYFRVTENAIIHSGSGNKPWDRFESFGCELKPWRKDGRNIIVIPPNKPMAEFLSIEDWVDKVLVGILKNTDRSIIISRKQSTPSTNPLLYSEIEKKIPQIKPTQESFDESLKDAWLVVTDHSNCMIKSLIGGVPIICTNRNRRIGEFKSIESPVYDREILKNLAYNQWTLEEMESGKAWRELNE